MFRLFEALVDPFQRHDNDVPATGMWPYIVRHLRTLRRIIVASLVVAAISAAIEIWLIGYAGRLADVLAATTPDQLWATRGAELLLVALIILIGRPHTTRC